MAQSGVASTDNEIRPRDGARSIEIDAEHTIIKVPGWETREVWSFIKTKVYQMTLVIYIGGPFIYTISITKKEEIPGMVIIASATAITWLGCASILGLSSTEYLRQRKIKISSVFLVILLGLTSVMKAVIDVLAIMMLSVVMATLCPGLKDEIPPLLPIYQTQNQV